MRRLLLILLVVAASCSGATNSDTTTSQPATTFPPEAYAVAYPVIVVEPQGTLTIPERPTRIVSLSATHTEMLYAIGAGDQVAVTDLTSNYPAAAANTDKVDSFAFNIEEVLAFDPDLAIIAFDFSGEMEAFDAAGVPAVLLPPAVDLAEVYRQFDLLGRITDNRLGAVTEVDRLKAAVAIAAPDAESSVRSVFYEVDETLFSANSATLIGQLFGLFGLANIADEAPDEFGSGFPQLSAEFIVESDPDIIFLGDAGFGVTAESLAQRPGWDQLSAVSEGAVFELDTEIAGRWGPRTDELIRQIAAALDSLG